MSIETTIELFSTCPPSTGAHGPHYLRQVAEVARWSERSGCKGMLVYSDNSQLDPWLVAREVIGATDTLAPLVAVQPVYTHPFTVAKLVATIARLYGRRVYLNLVAGGFKNDLLALGDTTPHDRRYDRLVEFMTVVTRLLRDGKPVDFKGEFYRVDNLRLQTSCPAGLFPGIFVSGSSEAGRAAAERIGATAIEYPQPAMHDREPLDTASGIRIGVISRNDTAAAWDAAHARFPVDREGQLTHQLAMKVSDSEWHRQLSELARGNGRNRHPYWLVPFENYKTMCPYLVGDYREVGWELAGYISFGYRTFITDVPASPDELEHTGLAFRQALEIAGCESSSRTG